MPSFFFCVSILPCFRGFGIENIKSNTVRPGSIVFYDAIVLLGAPGINQTEKELRVVGYRVDNKVYWVAANRYDLC